MRTLVGDEPTAADAPQIRLGPGEIDRRGHISTGGFNPPVIRNVMCYREAQYFATTGALPLPQDAQSKR